jgi:hypothetical protein
MAMLSWRGRNFWSEFSYLGDDDATHSQPDSFWNVVWRCCKFRTPAGEPTARRGHSLSPMRLFTACHGTQLLVIQHLRHHLQSSATRDFLLWHPNNNNPRIDAFMKAVISTAGFADTLDIRDFECLKPRTHNSLEWWFESVRRLRRDTATVRHWMARNGITEDEVELWTDDPIYFYVVFPRGMMRTSRHVKIPHCFNHEDVTSSLGKRQAEAAWHAIRWPRKFVLGTWQRWATGVDMRMDRIVYDRAYSFDLPSCWADRSVDVSHLISIDKFEATYETLPSSIRTDVETILEPIRACRRPLVLLLLFEFGTGYRSRRIYEKAVSRIFSERASELKNCTLAVKVHPGTNGIPELDFFDWLKTNIPAQIFVINHSLNLEFMLPQLRPDYVLAGVCGALPIIRKLKTGVPVCLSEVMDAMVKGIPTLPTSDFLKGIEVW